MTPRLSKTLKSLSVLTATLISACQTTATTEAVPAVLTNRDNATMEQLKTTLSKALNQKQIEFGATDWASPTLSVLPARGHSPKGAPFHQQDFARPKLFDLMIDSSGCYLLARDNKAKIALENISCHAL